MTVRPSTRRVPFFIRVISQNTRYSRVAPGGSINNTSVIVVAPLLTWAQLLLRCKFAYEGSLHERSGKKPLARS